MTGAQHAAVTLGGTCGNPGRNLNYGMLTSTRMNVFCYFCLHKMEQKGVIEETNRGLLCVFVKREAYAYCHGRFVVFHVWIGFHGSITSFSLDMMMYMVDYLRTRYPLQTVHFWVPIWQFWVCRTIFWPCKLT